MEILCFCPIWGAEKMNFSVFSQKVKQAGYDGAEMSLPFNQTQKQDRLKQLDDHGLQLIAQHFETLDSDFKTHKSNFIKRLYNLAEAKPKFINSQTGKDYYSFSQNLELLLAAKSIADETGVKIVHETHRGKFSFALHITEAYINELAWLDLTLDMSHWCNVSESFLEDQQESLALAISRSVHIHARVGHSEGPQINDPRAPEWEEALGFHLAVWDKVVAQMTLEGLTEFTFTPEFGPYPYMVESPVDRLPLANQWDVNVFMKDLLKKRYGTYS